MPAACREFPSGGPQPHTLGRTCLWLPSWAFGYQTHPDHFNREKATVCAAPSSLSADWDRIRQSLAVICVSHEELDRFFSSTFDQLEALSAELLQRQRAFLAEREQTEREMQRQATLLEQQRATLAAQFEQVAKDASAGTMAALSPETSQELQRMLEETAQQRTALCTAQQNVEAQATRLTELTDKLLQSQRELVEAQAEIQRQREALEASRAAASAEAATESSDSKELREQLQRLEQERAALAQERTLLEAELDAVRSRSAELAESLGQHQRQMAEDRARWADELKSLRRLVERLAEQTPERETVSVAAATTLSAPPANARREASEAGADPVLDSVMAQFAMLQKDLSKRRKANVPAE